jgi:excinuclease ABC subunit C
MSLDIINQAFNDKAFIPKIGDKKKLIDLCLENANNSLVNYHKLHQSKYEKQQQAAKALNDLIGAPINYIEVFDNAQLFGLAPISGMIVYRNQRFERKLYRKFNLKTANQDDYQAMREVIYRRYFRLLSEGLTLPDLICVDGGKGQVSAAHQVASDLELDIPIIGLMKDSRHELTALVYQGEVITLDRKTPLYQLMASLSEEVHRYTISFHKNVRDKKNFTSRLDQITGLGPKRKQLLLNNFDSLDKISNAEIEQLKALGFSEKLIKAIKEQLS